LLARALRDDGAPVRCLVRDPDRGRDLERLGCGLARGDVLDRRSLDPALEGVELAYYLVHSMGRGAGGGYADRDRRGAQNFAAAASSAGVERIVYLGGLGEPASDHLRSRAETARVLASAGASLTYFRAAAVIGGGSESFRVVYHLVDRLPAMVTPRWVATRTQPIAVDDVIAYLSAVRDRSDLAGREVEIGGPDVTTYGGLMDATARILGKRPPPRIPVPLLTPRLSSLWIGLVTPVDAGVARPLIEGLATETIVEDPSAMDSFGIARTSLDEALHRAADELRGSV
jgi:uncharacterized protein YbjT (DUF2867 family)